MRICILQADKEYLLKNILQDKRELARELEKGNLINDKLEINITNEIADEIRDLCSDKLQEVGFNEKYELTEEGRILEDLIDIFYVG